MEEQSEHIEHLTAGFSEGRRKDREEYKSLWRDVAHNIDALAVDTRLRFDRVADRLQELGDRIGRYAEESCEADRRLGSALKQSINISGNASNPWSRRWANSLCSAVN